MYIEFDILLIHKGAYVLDIKNRSSCMESWEFTNLLIERMENLYGKEIPDVIIRRYVREKNYLQSSDFQDEFRTFAELLMEMQQKKMKYSIVGTATHSFLLYLLLCPEMNPLPPYYYCPHCKEIVFLDLELNNELSMGIDLPLMRCECGCELDGNGFDLSEEFFWEREQLDLLISVSEKDYEFVKNWLYEDERLKGKDIQEEDFDDESIEKRYCIGIITVLAEKAEFITENKFGWNKVRKHKEMVIENYELLLPLNKKIKKHPLDLYEVIRTVAFFHTMYTKSTSDLVGEDDIIEAEEMYSLLEKFYDNDINKAPVFLEDGLAFGEWRVEDYKFLIMYSRAFAEFVLDEINDKLKCTF